MAEPHAPGAANRHPRTNYLAVFIGLGLITLVEVVMASLHLAPQAANLLFLAFSAAKASMVAAYFMHLRHDSRLYLVILLLPTAMLLIFAMLTVAS
jgi:caa(3)-type oxidase subunit IV